MCGFGFSPRLNLKPHRPKDIYRLFDSDQIGCRIYMINQVKMLRVLSNAACFVEIKISKDVHFQKCAKCWWICAYNSRIHHETKIDTALKKSCSLHSVFKIANTEGIFFEIRLNNWLVRLLNWLHSTEFAICSLSYDLLNVITKWRSQGNGETKQSLPACCRSFFLRYICYTDDCTVVVCRSWDNSRVSRSFYGFARAETVPTTLTSELIISQTTEYEVV